MELRLFFSLTLLALGTSPVLAGALKDARVNYASGDVRIVDKAGAARSAAPPEVIGASSTVLTGVQSRAELLFPDHTLTRIGSETALRFKPDSRYFLLDRGTLLVQVPKFHGGARVHMGSLTVTSGGATFLIEHLPTKSVKIVVLEGDLRVSVDRFLGDSVVLSPGKLLIMNPDVRLIPDPVDVDLRTLARTSSLINPTAFRAASSEVVAPLATAPLIERKIARQDKAVERKTLIPTNLIILGSGTNIVIPDEAAAPQADEPAAEPGKKDRRDESETRNSTKLGLDPEVR